MIYNEYRRVPQRAWRYIFLTDLIISVDISFRFVYNEYKSKRMLIKNIHYALIIIRKKGDYSGTHTDSVTFG